MLTTTHGTLSPVTDRGDGTYTATLTSHATGTAVIRGTVDGVTLADDARVTFTPVPVVVVVPSPAQTQITASQTRLPANNTSVSVITVTLRDGAGAAIATGGHVVALSTTRGTLSSLVDHGNGSYTATLRSSSTGNAEVRGTLNGASIADRATVKFDKVDDDDED